MGTTLYTDSAKVKIGAGPAVVIGEKINPAGRKKPAAAMQARAPDVLLPSASTGAEAVCRHFDALALAEGLQTRIPLNPGMIGWPLEEGQAQIFSLIDASEIGVALDPGTCLMRPLKSLSLVIGLGRDLNPTGHAHRACDFCSMRETCRYKDHYGGPNKPDDVSG